MLDQAEINIKIPQERFMKVYTIYTKPSSSAREKRENKISSHFQLNKKLGIFQAVRAEEDTLF